MLCGGCPPPALALVPMCPEGRPGCPLRLQVPVCVLGSHWAELGGSAQLRCPPASLSADPLPQTRYHRPPGGQGTRAGSSEVSAGPGAWAACPCSRCGPWGLERAGYTGDRPCGAPCLLAAEASSTAGAAGAAGGSWVWEALRYAQSPPRPSCQARPHPTLRGLTRP